MKTSEVLEQERKNSKGCAIALVIIVLLIIAKCTFGGTDSEPTEESKPQKTEENLKLEAFVYSQQCVEKQLKSPSTAKFPFYDEAKVIKFNDSTYIVSSHVDSQNTFGGMMRAEYIVRLTISKNSDTFVCNDTKIFE